MEERRVRFKTKDGLNGKTGTLIGEGSKGCAAIPDGTHRVLYLKHGEVEILPDGNTPPKLGEANPQPA